MNIDTEFNVGDSVCYLSGDNIIHTSISKIIIEISYEDDSFLMVYKLSDGVSVPETIIHNGEKDFLEIRIV